MKLTRLLLICLFIVCAVNTVIAQDIIKLKDSTELNVRIIKITPIKIFYKKATEWKARKFALNRYLVERVTYENGVVIEMSNDSYALRHHIVYGKNIISISPCRASEESGGNSKGNSLPGVGLFYEHILGKKGKLSFYLPLTLSFYSIYNETFADNGPIGYINFTQKEGTYAFFTMAPGVKFYPRGFNRRFTYNLGASLVIGFGRKYNTALTYTDHGLVPLQGNPGFFKDSITAVAVNESKPVFKAGLLITNGFNFMVTKHIYTAVELGFGEAFINNEYIYDHNRKGDGSFPNSMFEFNVKVGYRF